MKLTESEAFYIAMARILVKAGNPEHLAFTMTAQILAPQDEPKPVTAKKRARKIPPAVVATTNKLIGK